MIVFTARTRFTLLALTILAACAPAGEQITPPTDSEALPTPTAATPVDLADLPGTDILLQLAYEPTFSLPTEFYEYGRIPPFTMLVDGRVIYVDEGRSFTERNVMQIELSPDERILLLNKVLDLGFSNLESYTDECRDQADGTMVCIADASFTILRARLPDGEFRQVKIFAGFANDLQAFESITQFLTSYVHPSAQPYTPEQATLFIQTLEALVGVTVNAWPLADALVPAPNQANPFFAAVLVLEGDDLTTFIAALGGSLGEFYFEKDGASYAATLVPWLPGTDYREQIAIDFPSAPAAPPDPGILGSCPIPPTETDPGGRFQLVYLQEEDLWLLDEGDETPQGVALQLTETADVTNLRLTPSGRTVVYVRQPEGGPGELWALEVDGGDPRPIAVDPSFLGFFFISAFSFDEALMAFTLTFQEGPRELWVAALDGSGARRLLSHDDLMAVLNEPLADFAIPSGVAWLPGIYTVTYDSFPVFLEDGIYIYIQRQNLVVDALTGEKGVLFPAGEGGNLSFSPDGTSAALTTPDQLRLMNVEARDLQPAGVDYFAVGFGEYYAHPALVWTPDSQALLLAQPADADLTFKPDAGVSIWRVPRDGSPATSLLDLAGFFPSFVFSPDQTLVAYWQWTEANSDSRNLQVASLGGGQPALIEAGELIEFVAWAPDSRRMLYSVGQHPGKLFAGDICGSVQALESPNGAVLAWLEGGRFLLHRHSVTPGELYIGSLDGPASLFWTITGPFEVRALP